MKIVKEKYKVTLNFKSPLILNSDNRSSGIIIYEGDYVLPASTFQGIVRDKFRELISSQGLDSCKSDSLKLCKCPECSLFGNEGYNPGKVFYNDFKLKINHEKETQRTTIAVNRYTRNTIDGALVTNNVIEKPSFKSIIEIYFNEKTIEYKKYFITAIKSIDYIGSNKSRGYGFVDVEVENLV